MDTLPHILDEAVRRYGDRPALAQHGGADAPAYTYGDVGRLAERAAGRLAARGVEPAAAVALLSENRPEWGIVYFAIARAGAVCVPLDAHLAAPEIRTILRRSRTRLLVVSPALQTLAEEAAADPGGPAVVTLDDLLAEPAPGAAGAEPPAPDRPVSGSDVAVLSFTSGTTGTSKAIVLTHRNVASNASAGTERMVVSAEDRLLSILPLNHLFEQTAGLLIPLIAGASVTYPGSLNPRTLVSAMRASRTTIALVVPAVLRLFRKRILAEAGSAWKQRLFRAARGASRAGGRLGLPLGPVVFRQVHEAFGGAIRFFISGGAPLDPEVARFFRDLGLTVLEGYGLSEAAPIVSCNTLAERAAGSVGRPLPGVEVRIDPVAARDGIGEILVRGPNVMAGYFEDRRATDEALADGWLRTGDLGRIDEAGYLYVVGRSKDLIVGESGKNVYPEEIEAAIRLCPLVREVCVLGHRMPGAEARGEEVVALVVPDAEALGREFGPTDEEGLRAAVREACTPLPVHKRPRFLAVWPGEFPRTTTMKLKKHEIRRRLAEVPLKPL